MAKPEPPLTEPVLSEILRAFVHGESLPSDGALAELAVATGKAPGAIKDLYARIHAEEGHHGDPWALPGTR